MNIGSDKHLRARITARLLALHDNDPAAYHYLMTLPDAKPTYAHWQPLPTDTTAQQHIHTLYVAGFISLRDNEFRFSIDRSSKRDARQRIKNIVRQR